MLCTFAIGSLLPPYKGYSAIENRKYFRPSLESFNLLNLRNGVIFKDIEKVFDDQFFQRESFVKLYSWVQYKLGKKKINNRILGKDNYTFVVHYPRVLDHQITNLNELGDYCSKKGIDMFFSLIPTKDLVMIDKIPEYYRNDYSEVFDLFENKLSNSIDYINLYNTIKKAEKSQPQYYKTDHHWNTNGVFTAYREIVDRINNVLPEIGESHPRDNFKFETYEDIFIGSSGRVITTSVVKEYDDISLFYPIFNSNLYVESRYAKDYPIYHMDYISSGLYNNDYGVYLAGAEQDLKIQNRISSNDKTAVVVGISFAPPLTILLAEHFREINYVDLRYTEHESLYSLINEKQPDVVIFLYYSGEFNDILYTFK